MIQSKTFHSLFALVLLALLSACSQDSAEPTQKTEAAAPKTHLQIISGSENKALEPILHEYARSQNATIKVSYKGSVDIMLALEKAGSTDFHAVWPANSLWLRLGDQQKRVQHEKSIMRSPVVFAVKKSVVEALKWTNKEVTVADILQAAESGQLRFAMTSATQSNSGASAYLGFLHALSGSPDILQEEHLNNEDIQDKVSRLLRSINRSSGSSGWLVDLLLNDYIRFDAMVNYEALIIEANQKLIARGDEPLIAIYPVDGMMVADSPLAYVKGGTAAQEKLFLGLQEHLTSASVRQRIQKLGRRAGIVGLEVDNPDPAVFNKDWGIDTDRIISPVPLPAEPVIRQALSLYQTALRKPSLTIYAVDYSGSMQGAGNRELKRALETLLEPKVAERYMLQSSPKDIHIIVPFSNKIIDTWEVKGNKQQDLRQLLQKVNTQAVGGGTNIYLAASHSYEQLARYKDQLDQYFPAIILMTDGRSDGELETLLLKADQYDFSSDIPFFSITFGEAEKEQLNQIAKNLGGRVFDGKKDLVNTFRKAKGYN